MIQVFDYQLFADTVCSTILIINKLQQMRCSLGVTSRSYILVNEIFLLSSTEKNTELISNHILLINNYQKEINEISRFGNFYLSLQKRNIESHCKKDITEFLGITQ